MKPLLDAELAARVRCSLAALRCSGQPRLLWLSHALGGGVERHLNELVAAVAGRAWPLLLQPGTWPGGVVLRLPGVKGLGNDDEGLQLGFTWPQEYPLLQAWLQWLGVSRMHVHHLVGFPDAMIQALMGLDLPVDLTLHDHSILGSGANYPAGQLARTMQSLACRAQRIIVPSRSLADAVHKVLPGLDIRVQPHPDAEVDVPYPSPLPLRLSEQEVLRVLCLGTFTPEKGAVVLSRVARLAAKQGRPVEFQLLGDNLYPLPRSVQRFGAYLDADLDQLLRQKKPHLLWLPAQVPETWSYTLSAGLRAGLPILASDIGAISERLQGRPATRLLSPGSATDVWLEALLDMRAGLVRGLGKEPWPQLSVGAFYTGGSYLQHEQSEPLPESVPPPGLEAALSLGASRPGRWRRLVAYLARHSRKLPLLGRFLASASLRIRLKRVLIKSD